jgi:outer membrane immunogenic protein
MKSILMVSSIGLALASGSAFAADMPLKAPYAPAPSWTGCYVDGGGGYGLWKQDVYEESYPGLTQFGAQTTNGGGGWFGTAGLGCDYQFSRTWVVGAFGDFDLMHLTGTAQGNDGADPADYGNETEHWAWAVGARAGFLVNPAFLTYVNAGYTETRFDSFELFHDYPAVDEGLNVAAHTYDGWFLGGGVEYALGWLPGLFVRTEYRYSSYSAANVPVLETATGVASDFAMHSTKDVQTIGTELVWRFNYGH